MVFDKYDSGTLAAWEKMCQKEIKPKCECNGFGIISDGDRCICRKITGEEAVDRAFENRDW